VDIALALLEDARHSYGFLAHRESHPARWARVRSWLSREPLIARAEPPARIGRLAHLLLAFTSPTRFVYGEVDAGQREALRHLIEEHAPDFIWAELLHPAVVALQVAPEIPIVYGHQDWFWRIFQLVHRKSGRLRTWLHGGVRKRLERRLVRRAAACVSGSATESAELCRLGSRRVLYLPPTSDPVDLAGHPSGASSPRVIQFGGMQTAANRIALEPFLRRAWPVVTRSETPPPDLWVIGPMEHAPDSLRRELQEAAAVCPGWVADMDAVLRTEDIHVIPWEWDTGTRTRVPVALNYRQVLVSTRAGVACLPELTHERDCILVDDLEELGREIVRLLRDVPLRKRLACAGRATFLAHYTLEAVQPRFESFLKELRADLAAARR